MLNLTKSNKKKLKKSKFDVKTVLDQMNVKAPLKDYPTLNKNIQ